MPSSVLAIKHPDGHVDLVTEGEGEPVLLRPLDFQSNAPEDYRKILDALHGVLDDLELFDPMLDDTQ